MDLANTFLSLADTTKTYLNLHIDNVKLTAAEKLTVIISTAVILAVGVVISLVALFFMIVGIILFLQDIQAPFWAYMLVAVGFVIIFMVLLLLKQPLIVNPTARFISKLIIKDPSEN